MDLPSTKLCPYIRMIVLPLLKYSYEVKIGNNMRDFFNKSGGFLELVIAVLQLYGFK
jgi:hypothetical protein